MNDFYKVKKESITSIADSIRSKTGDTNNLMFPDEFVTAIESISGGTATPPPDFTYTGTYNLIDDGDGNWRIKFLTSGTITTQDDMIIDVFCVGGGASGSSYYYSNGATYYGAGGGSGYTTTLKSTYVKAGTYEIIIGAGGIGATDSSRYAGQNGGETSAFGVTASGGYGSVGAEPTMQYGGHGGSGGAGTSYTTGGTGGTDGGDGQGQANNGNGQGTTTREFGEADGTLYATGGDSGVQDAYIKAAIENSGNGGDGGVKNKSGDGSSGIVIIRNARKASGSDDEENGMLPFDYSGTYSIADDGDNNWRIKFLTSGQFTPQKSATIDVFLVGGGASGASGGKDEGLGTAGGGGGGGYTTTVTNVYVEANQEYEIAIGAGGAAISGKTNTVGNKGGTTSAFGYSITGGNPSPNYPSGGNGGSGGGAGYYGDNAGGTDGGDGEGSSSRNGKGQGTTTREFGESTGTLYATGGGNGTNASSVSVAYGEPNTGDGGNGSTSNYSYEGGSGIVVIRNARG